MATIFHRAECEPALRQALMDPTIPHIDVARRFEVGETSVRRYRSKQGISLQPTLPGLNTLVPEGPDKGFDVDDLPSERDLTVENGDLRAQNKRLFTALAKEKDKAQRIIQAVYDAARDAAENVTPAKPVPAPTHDKRSQREEVALVHATDWQRSKVTESYDSSICDQRVYQFADKVEEITDIMRADHPVRHGIVLFTGDMLEGCKIFPGQEWEVDATLFEQLFGVSALMESFVHRALEIFETIDVVAEYGNHGRIGKPSDGFKRSDNFDRIAYEIIKHRLYNNNRILTWKSSGDWYQHHSVGEYAFMAVHGDEIKSFGGNLPAYGIMRKANSWATGVVEPFTDLYIGHYHQSMQLQLANGGSVFMTGSTESHNEFAAEFVAATGRPSQRLNFINPDKGFVTYESRIWLD